VPTAGIARVVRSTSAARSANGEAVQRSMGVDGNAIAGDRGLKSLHTSVTEYVVHRARHDGHGLDHPCRRLDGCRPPRPAGDRWDPSGAPPRGSEKKRDVGSMA
jgi:hypothetical protein